MEVIEPSEIGKKIAEEVSIKLLAVGTLLMSFSEKLNIKRGEK